MDSWEDVDPLLLPLPFASYSTDEGPLLLKLLYNPEKATLALMATDLSAVFFEGLNRRQLQRRVQDALDEGGESQGSQGVMIGIGEDGEALLHDTVEKLLDAVAEGKAKVRLEQQGFDPLVKVTVPGSFTISFLTTSLEQRSSAVLSQHLVIPLLGVATSLLSLIPDLPLAQNEILDRVAAAVDTSGSAERREGTAAARFMQVGGGGLVSRWIQKTQKVTEADLQPITLTFPSSRSSRPFSPTASASPVKRKPSVSPATTSPPSRKRSGASPSSSRPAPSIAQRMLDSHGGAGERVSWDDSQAASSASSKGKGRAAEEDEQDQHAEIPPAAQSNASVDEEEPATDEEDDQDTLADSGPIRLKLSPTPASRAPLSVRQRPPARHLSPPPATGDSSETFLRSPTAFPAASQASQAFPPPTASPLDEAGDGEEGEEDSAAAAKKKKDKDQKKKKQKEKDAEEEMNRRKERLAKVAAAKGGAGGKKKAVKKL
ncbi:hypothetical protein JCM11251_006198 [Rhodosporidiobolus azoricus]